MNYILVVLSDDYEMNGPFESEEEWVAEAKRIDERAHQHSASDNVFLLESHLDGTISVQHITELDQ